MEELIKEIYAEVRCDYNNGEGFWTVDAWTDPDPTADENGSVIAVIHDTTGQVYYTDPCARYSPLAQEVIKEKVASIRKGDGKLPHEAIPSLDNLYETTKTFILAHQGKKGFISLEDKSATMVTCLAWLGDEYGNTEFKVHGVRVKHDDIQIVFENDNDPFSTAIHYSPEDFNSPDAEWESIKHDDILLYTQSLINLAELIHEHALPSAAEEGKSLSHATMRLQDLIPTFMDTLKRLWHNRWLDLICEYPSLRKAVEEFDEKDPWFESEEATCLLNEDIFDALNECAPEGCYFGSHPGNGSDYGFWPVQESTD